jgi:hypothetical protein
MDFLLYSPSLKTYSIFYKIVSHMKQKISLGFPFYPLILNPLHCVDPACTWMWRRIQKLDTETIRCQIRNKSYGYTYNSHT